MSGEKKEWVETNVIWIPTVGTVRFYKDGSATLTKDPELLSEEDTAKYRKMLDDYSEALCCDPDCFNCPDCFNSR